MLEGARGVLVAVSGGPDSVALLDLLVSLLLNQGKGLKVSDEPARRREEDPQPLRLSAPIPFLHIAHLDHTLRGAESAEDAEFVRDLANRLGIPITIRTADVRAVALRSGRGLEETAREVRYDFLLDVAGEAGCDRIAVGHTTTDQAETFLMRLIRGAGLRGLAGMRPVAPAHDFRRASVEKAEDRGHHAGESDLPSAFRVLPSVSIIRPLLCLTREEVESYCGEHHLEFRTDSTNLSLPYTRNRIRGEVLPALGSINPRIVQAISRAAENIAADQDVLDGLARSLLENARLASDPSRRLADGIIDSYSITALLKQPVGMRRRLLIEAMRGARERSRSKHRGARGEVTSTHIAAIEGLLAGSASGKHIVLPCSLEVWREFDALVIKTGGIINAPYQAAISSDCPDVDAGGFAFTLERDLPVEMLNSIVERTRQAKLGGGKDWLTVALDGRILPLHLVIRPRLSGERAHVLGRRQTIKLKKLMIDHKIPGSRRNSWPILGTPDGDYIWSPGLPPAFKFAAHKGTQVLAVMCASAI